MPDIDGFNSGYCGYNGDVLDILIVLKGMIYLKKIMCIGNTKGVVALGIVVL
mgnify:CR=1 FL=1